jgi:metal-responsive CopG/Arc/MetJ family transcriptional regulator
MKRITVSLPDDLVDQVRRAAGGEGQVSSYVASALADYQERETLDQILASWGSETPVPDDVRRQVVAELDTVGLAAITPGHDDRVAG